MSKTGAVYVLNVLTPVLSKTGAVYVLHAPVLNKNVYIIKWAVPILSL